MFDGANTKEKQSADEAEVAESLKVLYFPVFIEFEEVHAPSDEPQPAQRARQAFDAALLKFFNKNIRPFQHARLLVLGTFLDSRTCTKADLAAEQELPDDAEGWAHDCYGGKDAPKLKAAEAEEWSLADRTYKAEVQFLGHTTYTKEEIESISKFVYLSVKRLSPLQI